MKKAKFSTKVAIDHVKKGTSIGRNPITSTMNKHKRRSNKNYRGQGVFRQLYAAHKQLLSKQYDYCITEVSTRNLRSMQAHFSIGFELLHCFTDPQDEWNIVLWDWTK